MITFRDVHVTYPTGTKGLDGVSLEIPDGELVVVVGLSGAGKSTLVRTINGLVPVTQGELEVNGRRVDGASRRELRRLRADVGMIFQSFNLVTRVSVLNNVLLGRLAHTSTLATLVGAYGSANKDIAFDALERVGISEKAYTRASQLSGGQQQRVAIARVLAQQAGIVLADEPVASLDPPTAHAVMNDLRRVQRELGITTVVNLHFLDLARTFADRIIGMRAGKVVFDGTAEQADDAVFEHIYGRALRADDVATVDDVSVTGGPGAGTGAGTGTGTPGGTAAEQSGEA